MMVALTTRLAADWFAGESLTFEQLYLLYVYTDIFPIIEVFKPQFHSAKREKALQWPAMILTRARYEGMNNSCRSSDKCVGIDDAYVGSQLGLGEVLRLNTLPASALASFPSYSRLLCKLHTSSNVRPNGFASLAIVSIRGVLSPRSVSLMVSAATPLFWASSSIVSPRASLIRCSASPNGSLTLPPSARRWTLVEKPPSRRRSYHTASTPVKFSRTSIVAFSARNWLRYSGMRPSYNSIGMPEPVWWPTTAAFCW